MGCGRGLRAGRQWRHRRPTCVIDLKSPAYPNMSLSGTCGGNRRALRRACKSPQQVVEAYLRLYAGNVAFCLCRRDRALPFVQVADNITLRQQVRVSMGHQNPRSDWIRTWYSDGTSTETVMMGSRMIGCALAMPAAQNLASQNQAVILPAFQSCQRCHSP